MVHTTFLVAATDFVDLLASPSGGISYAGTLDGALLLYDEPDTSLHPSGARQLRDELLRLSRKNLVVVKQRQEEGTPVDANVELVSIACSALQIRHGRAHVPRSTLSW